MTGYYDYVLGLIPLSLAVISGVLTVAGLQLTTALPLASLVAVGLIGHAMFVNAPVSASAPSADFGSADSDSGFGSAD